MKQMIFLIATMGYLTFRSFGDPFYAVLMYYGLSLLRPQDIWNWALPEGIRWSLYAAILAITLTILRPKRLGRLCVQRPFIPLVIVFAALLVASTLGAANQQIAQETCWDYAKIIIMIVVGAFTVTKLRHVRYLAWAIFLCLTYIVYEMNAMYVFDKRLYIYHYGLGGYDNNGIALVLAMVIPFCFFFFFAETRWRRWVYLGCAIPAGHAIMLSGSRGAMLSAVIVAAGMILTSMKRHFIYTTMITVIATIIIASLAGPAVRDRFTSIGKKFRNPSAESRYRSWRAGWRIARDYPLLGVGLRNSNLITKDYGADMKGRSIHNIYLQIAADAGTPAAITFTAILAASLFWLGQAVVQTRQRLHDPELRWHHYICHAVFWSLVTFTIGAMFLSFETLELSYLLMLLAAVAPKLAAKSSNEPSAVSPEPVRRRPKLAMLSVGDIST